MITLRIVRLRNLLQNAERSHQSPSIPEKASIKAISTEWVGTSSPILSIAVSGRNRIVTLMSLFSKHLPSSCALRIFPSHSFGPNANSPIMRLEPSRRVPRVDRRVDGSTEVVHFDGSFVECFYTLGETDRCVFV